MTPGDGGRPTIAVLGAVGHGEAVFARLADRLAGPHRVVWCPALGTDPAGPPWSLDRQVAGIDAALRRAGADRVHLIAWCVGAKIATAFQRRRPAAVASLVFLNASFKQDGRDADLDTRYERNLEAICRFAVQHPGRAGRFVGLLDDGAELAPGPADDELRDQLRAPFRSPAALVAYARQLVELWAWDAEAHAPDVAVPALFVCSELDAVASPRRALAVARRFPRAARAQLAQAGHYVIHERPDLVAPLIADFVRDPGRSESPC